MKYTIGNFEEYAVDFLDGTMSQEEEDAFRKFLEIHPKLKTELQDLEDISLPIFNVTFPSKDKLLQREYAAKRRLLLPNIRNIAAAILLLSIVSFLWVLSRTNDNVIVGEDHSQESIDFSEIESLYENEKTPEIESEPQEIVKANATREKAEIASQKEGEVKNEKPFFERKAVDFVEESALVENVKDEYAAIVLKEIVVPEDLNTTKLRTVVQVQKIETPNIYPAFSGQVVPPLPEEMILISAELNEKEGPTKVGKLLAKINLFPTGLVEEFLANNLRESLLPEYYSDIKSQ